MEGTAPAVTPNQAISKQIKKYTLSHSFHSSLESFTTSQRRAFERDVYDYARALGQSNKQAEKRVREARKTCGEARTREGSAFEDEVDDSKAILSRLDRDVNSRENGVISKDGKNSSKRKGATPRASKFFDPHSVDKKAAKSPPKRKFDFDDFDTPTIPNSPIRQRKQAQDKSSKFRELAHETDSPPNAVVSDPVEGLRAETKENERPKNAEMSVQEQRRARKEAKIAEKAAKKAAKEERKAKAESKKQDQGSRAENAQTIASIQDSTTPFDSDGGHKHATAAGVSLKEATKVDKKKEKRQAREEKKINQQKEKEKQQEEREKRMKFFNDILQQRDQPDEEPAHSHDQVSQETQQVNGSTKSGGGSPIKEKKRLGDADEASEAPLLAKESDRKKKSKKRKSTGAIPDQLSEDMEKTPSKKGKKRRKSSGDEIARDTSKKGSSSHHAVLSGESQPKKGKKKTKKGVGEGQDLGF